MTVDQVLAKSQTILGTKIYCLGTNDRDLDGQCVTYIKQVMAWCDVPTAWLARNHAKYAGDNYVRDGLAVPVAISQIQKGDILVNPDFPPENGHIAIYDGAGGVYESNYSLTRKLSHRGNLAGFTKAYRPTFYSNDDVNNTAKGDEDMKNFKVKEDPATRWVVRADGTLNNVVDSEQVRILDAFIAPVEIYKNDLGVLLDALKVKH